MRAFLLVVLCGMSLSSEPSRVTRVEAERSVECGPGWTVSLTRTRGIQRSSDSCVASRPDVHQVSVAASDWQRLLAAIESQGFDSLPSWIERRTADGQAVTATDDDILCIKVAMRGTTREVCGEEESIQTTAEGARFLGVWREIIAIAPEPD